MDSLKSLASGSAERVFHKEKSSKKENKRTKGLSPIGYREGSTATAKTQEANGNRSATEAAAKRRKAAQVDDYLYGLVMEGIVDLNYISWHAKAIYALTITRYNVLVVIARRGTTPQKLLVHKVKSALEYQSNANRGVEY